MSDVELDKRFDRQKDCEQTSDQHPVKAIVQLLLVKGLVLSININSKIDFIDFTKTQIFSKKIQIP